MKKWELLFFAIAVTGTIAVNGRSFSLPKEKVWEGGMDNLDEEKHEIKKGCRPPPGSAWCRVGREISMETYREMLPLQSLEENRLTTPKRAESMSRYRPKSAVDKRDHGCRPPPGSPWCSGKREKMDSKKRKIPFGEQDESTIRRLLRKSSI